MGPYKDAGFHLKAVAHVQDNGEQTRRQKSAIAASVFSAEDYSAAQGTLQTTAIVQLWPVLRLVLLSPHPTRHVSRLPL